MQIAITGNQLLINNTALHFPIDITILKEVLGPCRHVKKKYNHIYTWDESGILACSKNGKVVETIILELSEPEFDFSPAKQFSGSFTVEQEDYKAYLEKHRHQLSKLDATDESGTLTAGNYDIYYDQDGGLLRQIGIEQHVPPPPRVYSDKYKLRSIEGEKITFTDFNFKLAVIQVLMYEKKLLKPEFDLYDFVDNYEPRRIDVEKEGYAFIPEVTDWFMQLEIDKKFAGEITEIIQDGGDDIYGHMLRFWSGEDNTFNITNFEDVKHFPNLRKMSLFYADNLDEIRQTLAASNIELETI